MVARISLNTIAQGFNLVQNGQPLQAPALGSAAGRDGVLSQQEAQTLQNVFAVDKSTGESATLANLMSQNNIGGIALDLSSNILSTPDLTGLIVPLSEISKGFVTRQNGKAVKDTVLAGAAGTDGVLTVEEATALKNVIVTNRKTGETLNIADCMIANVVGAIDLNDPSSPGGLKGVPISELAKTFSAQQNGQAVDPALLLKAAGKDGLLTVKEAASLQDVILTNNDTGETLNLVDCMIKNGVASIDLNEPDAGVPLADILTNFSVLQNGQDVDLAVLAQAAGTDGILTRQEAAPLQNVIAVNKQTGRTLNLADCMAVNKVSAIDLRDAIAQATSATGSPDTSAQETSSTGETAPTDTSTTTPTSTTDDTSATTTATSARHSFRQGLIQLLQQMLEMMMQLFFQTA